MATVINRSGTSAIVHVTANDTVVIAGNTSVSNIASSGEVLTGGSITQIWWGTASNTTSVGYWEVKRGSNTVLVLTETGSEDFAGSGAALTADAAANVVITLNGSTKGYLMFEVQKQPTSTGYTS